MINPWKILRSGWPPWPEQYLLRTGSAVLTLLFAWWAAAALRWAVKHAARLQKIERWFWRAGLSPQLLPRSFHEWQRWIGNALYGAVLAAGGLMSCAISSDRLASHLLGLTTTLLPSALLFALTATAAWWLSRYWSRSALIWLANEGIRPARHGAAGVRLLVLAAGLALACEISGFAIALVRPAFLIVLAGSVATGAYAIAPTLRAHAAEILSGQPRQPEDAQDRALLR